MAKQPIKISENCWKHTEYGSVFYRKTSDPKSKLHREDGPAIESAGGTKAWYINGMCHRENGPAIEYTSGSKSWYINDKLHRLDGPAIECADGEKHWYINDKLHRIDGPAIEWSYGDKEWYYNGKRIYINSQEEFELYLKNLIFI